LVVAWETGSYRLRYPDGVPPARFGVEAVRDPRFVFDLRNGREPRARTVAKVEAYIARIETEPGG
jgi:hypothetical protein